MGRPASKRKCPTCGQSGLKRNGTRNGKVRWRCTKCGASKRKTRSDVTEVAQWAQFHSYISGKASQAETDGTKTGRSLRRDLAWCWRVPVPKPIPTGEIYPQLFLDGKRIAYGWTLLVAVDQDTNVVSWQWAISENTQAYEWLIKDQAPPELATVDGAQGALSAINTCWVEGFDTEREGIVASKIQRCLVHIHRNNVSDLTRNPKTDAGKALLGLSQRLLRVVTSDEASTWEALLQAFYNQYGDYLKERTQAKDDPKEAARRGKTWWYTHQRDRNVYFRLKRLTREGVLFNYIDAVREPPDDSQDPKDCNLHKTTNIVESINAGIDNFCFQHRGLSEAHLICAIEWHLLARTENPPDPRTILKNWNKTGRPSARILPRKHQPHQERHGPKQYDTQTTAEEGLWTRKGWGGRSL